ncbi:hypothetical protein FRC17_005084 [Serendipita sp. 399]|nr:hypothetical protein FRC17_005084 [Serendipita sp. 399]
MARQTMEDQVALPPIDFSHLKHLRIVNQQDGGTSKNGLIHFTAICGAPALRAVSIDISLLNSGLLMPQFLTHLRLDCFQYPLHPLNLPLLKYLQIFMDVKSHTQVLELYGWQKRNPFGTWTFPMLVTLRVGGTIRKGDWEPLCQLIINCCSTIVNFISDFRISVSQSFFDVLEPPASVLPPILDACIKVATLGLRASSILSKVSKSHPSLPLDSHPADDRDPKLPKSLLVLGMGTFGDYKYEQINHFQQRLDDSSILEVLIGSSATGMSALPFTRVIIPYTWSELGEIWDELHKTATRDPEKPFHHPSVPAWIFLNHFIRRGMDVFDGDGVALKDGGMWLFDSRL